MRPKQNSSLDVTHGDAPFTSLFGQTKGRALEQESHAITIRPLLSCPSQWLRTSARSFFCRTPLEYSARAPPTNSLSHKVSSNPHPLVSKMVRTIHRRFLIDLLIIRSGQKVS